MKRIGSFHSKRWGAVEVMRSTYDGPKGPTAIVLFTPKGQQLATLSVNMYCPECSHDSSELPKDCFYAKTWSENETLAREALASGLFTARDDMEQASSGFVTAPVWQLAGSAA